MTCSAGRQLENSQLRGSYLQVGLCHVIYVHLRHVIVGSRGPAWTAAFATQHEPLYGDPKAEQLLVI